VLEDRDLASPAAIGIADEPLPGGAVRVSDVVHRSAMRPLDPDAFEAAHRRHCRAACWSLVLRSWFLVRPRSLVRPWS